MKAYKVLVFDGWFSSAYFDQETKKLILYEKPPLNPEIEQCVDVV